YLEEGIVMPYTFEEFRQHYTTAFLKSLTPEENAAFLNSLTPKESSAFLNSLTPEERLRGLPAAQVVKQFSPKVLFEQFSPKEVVKQFSPKEVLTELGLPPDVMAELLATINQNKKD
ncbi:MAG: hypothetical protein DRR19_25860, partial [Candidatus Parabeggiatoa sp. nov. 1]